MLKQTVSKLPDQHEENKVERSSNYLTAVNKEQITANAQASQSLRCSNTQSMNVYDDQDIQTLSSAGYVSMVIYLRLSRICDKY